LKIAKIGQALLCKKAKPECRIYQEDYSLAKKIRRLHLSIFLIANLESIIVISV